MKKNLLINCLVGCLVIANAAMASNDSIYFYKSGQIFYKRAVTEIDSVTFVPIDYYDVKNNEAIFQAIQAIPEISLFVSILEKTGLHKSLAEKTIWAPTNKALANIDLNNRATLDSLVNNHVSNGLLLTNSNQLLYNQFYLPMLNGKSYLVNMGDPVHRIENCALVTENIRHSNCVIHIIDSPIPYVMNVWEYLSHTTVMDEADVFKGYVQSMTKMDAKGAPINDVLEYVGDLRMESKKFVVVLPTRRACTEAFNKLYGYLHANNDTASEKEHINDCQWLLVRDQFLEVTYVDQSWRPKATYFPETMKSVFGQTFTGLDLYRDSVSSIELSNGRIVFVDTIRQIESLFAEGEISLEAEEALITRVANVKLEKVSTDKTSLVSGSGYLKCIPTTTGSISITGLTVPIPRVRPGHYRILVEVVPPSFEDSTDVRTNLLTFQVSTVDINKQEPTARTTTTLSKAATTPATMTRITIAENFYFPYIGIFRVPGKTPIESIVINNVATKNQVSIHDRTFRIDKIILERLD